MKIVFKSKANKNFQQLPLVEKKKVARKIKALADDPLTGKPLKGEYKGLTSLRAWPYRIVYEYQHRKKQIIILHITHRKSAYR